MLLYNENFSVLPLTTHIPLKNVHRGISFKKIEKACNNINYFYSKILKRKKIKIEILKINKKKKKKKNILETLAKINKWKKKKD